MPNETPFQITLMLSIVAFVAVRVYYRRKTGTLQLTLPQDHKLMGRVVLLSLVLTLLVMVIWLINPNWMSWSALPLPGWVRWCGVGLAFASVLFLKWVHQTLGASYSQHLQIREQHKLITSGPYRWVRHPMYSVIFLWTVSLGLIMSNWMALPASLAFALFFMLRAPDEEKMMSEEYGDEYQDYMTYTGRFLPRLIR